MDRGHTLREPTLIAFETMRAHRLRTFLILLGIILAVSSLILVVSLIQGTNGYIAERVANMGSDVFLVTRFGLISDRQQYVTAIRRNKNISWEDYEWMRDSMKLPQAVGAETGARGKVHCSGKTLDEIAVRGVTANIGEMHLEEVAQGRYITGSDNDHRAMVCVIGADVRTKFFPNVDPLGRTIAVDGHEYTIIGLAKAIGTVMGLAQDGFVYIPIQSFIKVYGMQNRSININIKAPGPDWMERTKEEARTLMRGRHHLNPDDKDTFGIVSSDTIMRLWNDLTGTLKGAMVGMVSVFLLIGGVMIMNMMLASVTERTREIGIRKALGASSGDILRQFLIEASLMSTMGGALGVAIASMLAIIIEATTPLPMSVPLWAVVTAIVLSTAVGVFFGVYPARRASKLDPIEALRYEM